MKIGSVGRDGLLMVSLAKSPSPLNKNTSSSLSSPNSKSAELISSCWVLGTCFVAVVLSCGCFLVAGGDSGIGIVGVDVDVVCSFLCLLESTCGSSLMVELSCASDF